jgi:hypothetical protein
VPRKKKQKTPFAISEETGKLFVRIDAVMTPLVALCDGLTHVFFGRSKVAYMEVDTAIEWCRKEMQHHSKEKYELMIRVMERFKEEAAAGTVKESE